ncbi:MAG: hypothetical protein ACP5G2_03720 [Candidatus Bipolaricaulaceae bacterium]
MNRALVLFSGSLASQLALRLAEAAGAFDLQVVHFRSPFFAACEQVRDHLQRLAPGIPFRTHTLKREYLHIAADGTGLPFPCGACRRVLLRKAARAARRLHAGFVITGEVVGRGGMGAEELMALDSGVGLSGRVLRPLSAQLLPAPRWAPRQWGYGFAAGDEEELARLGRRLGVSEGVGADRRCRLTDPGFVQRLSSLLAEGPPTVNALRLLEFRHFFHLRPDIKVVVATAREELESLQTLFLPTDVRLYLPVPNSPLALVRADWSRRSAAERMRAVGWAAQLTLAVAGRQQGETERVCFRFEWEEETKRLVATSPGLQDLGTLGECSLMSAPAEVYSLG